MNGKGATFMIPRSVFFVLWFMLLSTCTALGPRSTVVVTNKLEGGPDLFLHCRSADDDLGVQDLRPDASFSFSFRTKYFATTLFHCSFQWETVTQKFDIYDANRDPDVCMTCRWIVKENGPCLILPGNKSNCYPWNSDKKELEKP